MSEMSPSDAHVALRSLPRRFRAAVATLADERRDERAARPGPDGRSVVDLVAATIAVLDAHDRAVAAALRSDEATVDVGADDRPTGSLDDLLDRLGAASTTFADRVGDASADSWTRTATLASTGESVRAIDLVRRGVTDAVALLDEVAGTVRAVTRD